MRRRILIQVLLSVGLLDVFMILTAPNAYADNCGSLGDCFQTTSSAASVIAGVAVIITMALLALPSLLGTTESTSTPPGPDPAPQPQQPDAPPESVPQSHAQMHQQHHEYGKHPEHQPDEVTGHMPEHQPVHPGPHPPEHPRQHHAEGPSVQAPDHSAHMQAPDQHSAHVQPFEQHSAHVQPFEQHATHIQPPDQHSAHVQPSEQHSAHVQAPDQHSAHVQLPPNPLIQPPVRSLIYGIHHVTAIAGNPQQNIDFYTGLLGLRLVKQTVSIDNPNTYHLYYGDELGRPSTVLSFLAWPNATRGSRGSGQAIAIAFSVPEDALNYWAERLSRSGIKIVQPPARFDQQMFSFYDPDGLQIDMVAHRDTGTYPARSTGPIPPAYAIRGIYSLTLLEANYDYTHVFLTEVLGFRQVKAEGNRFRYEVGGGGPGTFLDILNLPGIPPSQIALGNIHHLAWRTAEDEQQMVLQQKLTSLGINLTQGIDPLYFPSYSFREPGGVLFEVAGLVPGFTIDEPPEQLGTHLMLPPWLTHRRAELQQFLPPLRLPFAGG